MTPFEVHTNSWHYRIAKKMTVKPFATDFCTYWRAVVTATIAFAAAAAVVAATCALILTLVAWAVWRVAAAAYTGNLTTTSVICAGALVVTLTVYLVMSITFRREEERDRAEIEELIRRTMGEEAVLKRNKKLIDWRAIKDKSFIVQAYRAHRDKYCVPVKVIYDEDSTT